MIPSIPSSPGKGHAVAVLIVTPEGIPLVRDPKKPAPIFWKIPGGRGDASETAIGVAIREIREELGLVLSIEDLRVIHSEDKGNHVLTIFRADLPTLQQINTEGNEREEVRVFTASEILAASDFFPNHRRVVGRILSVTA